MVEIIEIIPKCSFSWEKLKEMRDKEIKFWAADGLNLLRIIEIDEKRSSFYMINQSGKMTWPLQYEKLEEVHNKIHITRPDDQENHLGWCSLTRFHNVSWLEG